MRGRSPELVAVFAALEAFVRGLGEVELVTRERYVLFRTTRIFADLTVMSDALRLVVHLGRQVDDPMFEKVVADRRHVSHVVKVRTLAELEAALPFVAEAHGHGTR